MEDGHEEGCGLARARLRAGHQVATGQDDRDAVLLYRGGLGVAGQLDIVPNDLGQLDLVELRDRTKCERHYNLWPARSDFQLFLWVLTSSIPDGTSDPVASTGMSS